jgi:membrane associated rhomboid family serine protease
MDEEDEAPLRSSPDEAQARDWALALVSANLASRLDHDDQGWHLFVAEADRGHAQAVLDAYDDENRPEPAPPPARFGLLGAWVAAGLALFFLVTGPRAGGGRFFVHGSALAERIVAGEVWRALTALTLHADLAHLLGNAASAVVFLGALAGLLGPGLAALAMLVAGIAGNLCTAWVHGARHDSVGASTALFAALGALAALQLVARRRAPRRGRPAWIAAAAGLALLAFLGTGEGSDLLAHAFGFLAGALLGAFLSLLPRPPRPALQVLFAAITVAAVAGAWLLALRA